MILKFPDLNTLRLALMSGVLPRAVIQASVVAGFDEKHQLWVEFNASLARGVLAELRNLGVQSVRANEATATAKFGSWLELVPLQADNKTLDRPEQKPVLFELSSGADLTRIVFEILRLGNDRQSFRWLENDNGEGGALLRVIGPPYYSLLRALDRNGQPSAPIAYVERSPNVWVELGHTHPFIDLIKPPKGKLLLLRPPQQWTLLDDAAFRDIYDIMEFELPDAPVAWRDQPLADKIKIALKLKAGGSLSGAQMWVLSGDAIAELNRLVQNANERLLTQIAFAVGDTAAGKTVVLRALHSKSAPPELVLNARPYRTHLRLPNLFLPTGMQLQPPLRRDVVRKLLAEDTEHVVWLVPSANGSFSPHSLPENAFRPLTDWIAYVLDQDREPLTAWMQAMHFDFEPFVCGEDGEPKPKKPAKDKQRPSRQKRGGDETATAEARFENVDKTRATPVDVPEIDLGPSLANLEPNVLQQQLRTAEERFLAVEGDLEAAERRKLWPDLANLNAALAMPDEAGLCWLAALWFQDKTPATWAQNWLAVEASAVRARAALKLPGGRTWTTGVLSGAAPALDALLASSEPSVADLRALAAYVVWAASLPSPPPGLLERLQAVQRFLEVHERLLPVRAAWLAWSHLVRLSRGDVLALTRTRDRLLERLYQNGLRAEVDLPSFLRFSGQPVSHRYRGMRQWMIQMCELAHMWAEENGRVGDAPDSELPAPMKGYIDLLFAFGLARLGEHDACRQLLQRAAENLANHWPVHSLLFKAFEYRIRQALAGKPCSGPLPEVHFLALKEMDELSGTPRGEYRYAVERMRCESRILEPEQAIDPYRHYTTAGDDLAAALARLPDVPDRLEVAARIETLWQKTAKGPKSGLARLFIVREALSVGPRINEDFSRKMLERALPVFDAIYPPPGEPELEQLAVFLERALFVAAHFDLIEFITPLIGRFKQILQIPAGNLALGAIIKTANKCFRGLRKLGMRDQFDELMGWLEGISLDGRDLGKVTSEELAQEPKKLRVLLEIAAGWYYMGREKQADPILTAARSLLYKDLFRSQDKTLLARSYVAAVGQRSVETAQPLLEELFTHLRGIRDGFMTAEYYNRHQLEIIESVILAVTHDDFTLGVNARRWLDDDEFLVRKRIHNDVRTLLNKE